MQIVVKLLMDLVHKSYCLHIAVVFFIKKIKYCNSDIYLTVKVMWHTAKYGDPYSEFVLCINPSNVPTHISEHTHSVNTHTPWTHTRSSGQPFMLRCPGSSRGFGALLKGTSVVVLMVKSSWTFTPLTYNRLSARDSNSQPFVYESNSHDM